MESNKLYVIQQFCPKDGKVFYIKTDTKDVFLQNILFTDNIYEARFFERKQQAEVFFNSSSLSHSFQGIFKIKKIIKRDYEQEKIEILDQIIKDNSDSTEKIFNSVEKVCKEIINHDVLIGTCREIEAKEGVYIIRIKDKIIHETKVFKITKENIINWRINKSY